MSLLVYRTTCPRCTVPFCRLQSLLFFQYSVQLALGVLHHFAVYSFYQSFSVLYNLPSVYTVPFCRLQSLLVFKYTVQLALGVLYRFFVYSLYQSLSILYNLQSVYCTVLSSIVFFSLLVYCTTCTRCTAPFCRLQSLLVFKYTVQLAHGVLYLFVVYSLYQSFSILYNLPLVYCTFLSSIVFISL